MPDVTFVLQDIPFLFLPSFWHKLTLFSMAVEVGQGKDEFLALFWVKRTVELQLYFLSLVNFEGLGTLIRTLVLIQFDAVHALRAEVLLAGASADTGLVGNVIADDALILGCLFCGFDKIFGL